MSQGLRVVEIKLEEPPNPKAAIETAYRQHQAIWHPKSKYRWCFSSQEAKSALKESGISLPGLEEDGTKDVTVWVVPNDKKDKQFLEEGCSRHRLTFEVHIVEEAWMPLVSFTFPIAGIVLQTAATTRRTFTDEEVEQIALTLSSYPCRCVGTLVCSRCGLLSTLIPHENGLPRNPDSGN